MTDDATDLEAAMLANTKLVERIEANRADPSRLVRRATDDEQRSREAVAELTQQAQDLGLYDD